MAAYPNIQRSSCFPPFRSHVLRYLNFSWLSFHVERLSWSRSLDLFQGEKQDPEIFEILISSASASRLYAQKPLLWLCQEKNVHSRPFRSRFHSQSFLEKDGENFRR